MFISICYCSKIEFVLKKLKRLFTISKKSKILTQTIFFSSLNALFSIDNRVFYSFKKH